MLLIGTSGVWCGLSRAEVCLGPVTEEVERSALVMRFLSSGLLSRCAGLLRGIENVREIVFFLLCECQKESRGEALVNMSAR